MPKNTLKKNANIYRSLFFAAFVLHLVFFQNIFEVFAKVRLKQSILLIVRAPCRVREVESYPLSKFQPPTTLGDPQKVEKTIRKKFVFSGVSEISFPTGLAIYRPSSSTDHRIRSVGSVAETGPSRSVVSDQSGTDVGLGSVSLLPIFLLRSGLSVLV